MNKRRLRRWGLGLAVVLVAGAGATGTAQGNVYGPNFSETYLFWPDNGTHTFSYFNLEPAFNSAMNWARVDALGRGTDMSEVYDSTPDNQTDVNVYDGNYGSGPGTWRGHYKCFWIDALDPNSGFP